MWSLIVLGGCKSREAVSNPPVVPAEEPATAAAVRWVDMEKGQYCGIESAENHLIKSQEDWQEIWDRAQAYRMPPPELPDVDFEKEQVIACFMGSQYSGGHYLEIADIQAQNDELKVVVNAIYPGKNCIVTQAITSPFVMVKIAKTELQKVNFSITETTENC